MKSIPVLGGELLGQIRRPAVQGLDPDQRPVIPVEQVEAVAVARTSGGNDLGGIDPGFRDAPAEGLAGIPPQLIEVSFDVAGLGRRRLSIYGARRDLPTFQVK